MRSNLTIALTMIVLTLLSDRQCAAQDWMYRRSWFSHLPVEGEPEFPVPAPQGAIRRAVPQLGPGFAVRGKYRWNIYRLQNGQSYDTTIFRQFSIEATPPQ